LDRKDSLNDYSSIFCDIASNADNLIKNNGYDPIQFYGIILCYLNYYDYKNFQKYFQIIYNSKNPEILYEILLIYNTNLFNPINQDLEFFVKFIEYTVSKKEFENFENLLNYILVVETFIIVIDKTKEKIIENYENNFKTIKIKYNLILKKKEKGEEMNIIIPSIESIINFSIEKEKLLIYFTSNFYICYFFYLIYIVSLKVL
jgi:hypothetical protein